MLWTIRKTKQNGGHFVFVRFPNGRDHGHIDICGTYHSNSEPFKNRTSKCLVLGWCSVFGFRAPQCIHKKPPNSRPFVCTKHFLFISKTTKPICFCRRVNILEKDHLFELNNFYSFLKQHNLLVLQEGSYWKKTICFNLTIFLYF